MLVTLTALTNQVLPRASPVTNMMHLGTTPRFAHRSTWTQTARDLQVMENPHYALHLQATRASPFKKRKLKCLLQVIQNYRPTLRKE